MSRFLFAAPLPLVALLALTMAASAQTPPPRPPASVPGAPAKATTPAATPAKAEAGAPVEEPTIERVNAYFNTIKGMQARFVQTSPDGRKFGGTLYLLRPGRMRFEYNAPATLEIVADGRSVAVRDRKLNTQDLYFIGQTPLKFLLQPRINVGKDSTVTGLKRQGDEIILNLEDKSTFGGTSLIRIAFDGTTHAIKEWTVTDAQGNNTRVALSNLNMAAQPDKNLFVIDEQKILEPRN